MKTGLTSELVLVLVLLTGASSAEAGPLKLRGYAETRYTRMLGIDLGSLCDGDPQGSLKGACDPNVLYNRIRPSVLFKFGSKARARMTANFTTAHFRLERKIESIGDLLTLERLYIDLRTKYVDLRAGKQSLQWGPAQLFSLTTPYSPQDPTDLNAERPGLWALTAYIPYGTTAGFRLAILASPDLQNTIEVVRWNHTFGTTEVAATVVEDGANRRITFGGEVKGQLEVGFWVEAAAHVPYDDGKDPSVAVAVGVDYTISLLDGLYLVLQYYYDSRGISDPAQYPFKTAAGLLEMAKAFQPTGSASSVSGVGVGTGGFLGAHYLLLMARLTISEDLSLSLTTLANVVDPSALVGPFLAYTLLQDFTVTVGAYFFLGPEGSEFSPGRLKIPGLPADGVKPMPLLSAFAWLKYSF